MGHGRQIGIIHFRVRVGGFGGIDGLISYLRDNGIGALIDATHPFAAQMSVHAVAAAEAAGDASTALRARLAVLDHTYAAAPMQLGTVEQRIASALPADTKAGFAQYGAWLGAADTLELARLANRHLPQLKTHDAKGNRIDLVEFHPAYHALMRRSVAWDQRG